MNLRDYASDALAICRRLEDIRNDGLAASPHCVIRSCCRCREKIMVSPGSQEMLAEGRVCGLVCSVCQPPTEEELVLANLQRIFCPTPTELQEIRDFDRAQLERN